MAINKLFNKLNCLFSDRQDSKGRTKLYKMAKQGNLRAVSKLLYKCNANPNISTKNGLTALHQASYWGEIGIVELLLVKGANPNVKDSSGLTPLHSAALSFGLNGRKKTIRALLKAGADPSITDADGLTALHYAKLWDSEDQELIERLRVSKLVSVKDKKLSDQQIEEIKEKPIKNMSKEINLLKYKPKKPKI